MPIGRIALPRPVPPSFIFCPCPRPRRPPPKKTTFLLTGKGKRKKQPSQTKLNQTPPGHHPRFPVSRSKFFPAPRRPELTPTATTTLPPLYHHFSLFPCIHTNGKKNEEREKGSKGKKKKNYPSTQHIRQLPAFLSRHPPFMIPGYRKRNHKSFVKVVKSLVVIANSKTPPFPKRRKKR